MRRLRALAFGIAAVALTAAGQSQAPFVITTQSVTPAVVGLPYTPATLQSSGDPGPIEWSIASGGTLPPGFVVGSAPIDQVDTSGYFCYSPFGSNACTTNPVGTSAGSYPFVIQARSLATGRVASRSFTLVVLNPLQIVSGLAPPAVASQPYSFLIQGAGGSGQYAWSIINGALPLGIELDPGKGVVSGFAPGADGTYTFTVQLLDQVTAEKVARDYTITVTGGLAIITTALPNATLSENYTFQFLAKGGFGYFWSPAVQLPAGFSLSSDGVLSGFPVNTGTFVVSVQVSDLQREITTPPRVYNLLVSLGPLEIKELALPGATQNLPYSVTLTAAGGIPPYTWISTAAGQVGLTLGSTSGTLSGTPPNAGVFTIPITLRDSTGVVFTRSYELRVGAAVSITKASFGNGSVGVPYSDTLTATGGVIPYLRWDVIAGSLPPGLVLTPASGLISGTPTTPGSFPFTAQITDFVGAKATKVFTVTIAGEPLTITTTSLPGASLNQPYSQALAATGGVPPITWTLTSGSLQFGLTLDQTTGVISGTPHPEGSMTAVGTASFTVQARDAAQQTASRSLTLTVTAPLTISAANFTTSVGVAVSEIVVALGGAQPYAFTVSSGSLPAGLTQNASTGVISGTPSATGTFPVTLRVTDAGGRTAVAPITIIVNALPLVIGGPANSGSGQQPAVSVSVGAPLAGDVNGTLALAFASSVGGTDDIVRFSNGSRSLTFSIARGATTATFPSAPNATVITGTVAGTITLTASVPGSPDTIKTIIVDPAVPVITSVALQQVAGGLSVVVSGYSNTREVSSGTFSFTVSGSTQPAVVTVQLTSAYTAWFGSTASNATGGQFRLTVPFTVSQGTATSVTRVSVTLTNSRGTSAAASSP